MKKQRLGTWTISICCIVFSNTLLIEQAQSKELIDKVAIIVDDQAILESDIDRRLQELELQIAQRSSQAPPRHVLVPQLIERMILESIQNHMADRFQIQVSDSEVNKALTQIAQRQNQDLNEFLQELKAKGQSTSSLREQIENELKHYQLQQRVLSNRVQVTQKEVDEFLQSKEALENQNIEYKLRHILLQISERAKPEDVQQRQDQANAIITAIKNGENTFEQSAIAISNDSFALKGGDMGWRRISQVPARFTKALLNLSPGEMAKPIRSPSGFHILMLEDTRGEETVMVERAKIKHILIKPNQIRSDEQAEQFAIDLRQHIIEGKTLAELARTFSDDPGSALNGGDLGWVSLKSLDPTFAQTARTLKIGELSQVFRSQFGYHLLEVIDRKEEDMSKALRQSRAQRWLQQRKFEEYLPVWLSEIRSEAYVEFKPPYDTMTQVK